MEFVKRRLVELLGVRRDKVAQAMPLEIRPQLLDRIKLGSVRWQGLQAQARVVCQQLADFRPAMHIASVPDDDDRAAQMLEQWPHKPVNGDRLEMVVD